MIIVNSTGFKTYKPETKKEFLTICFDIIWDNNLQEKVVDEFFKNPNETAYELFFRIVEDFSTNCPSKLSINKNGWSTSSSSSSYPILKISTGEITCL